MKSNIELGLVLVALVCVIPLRARQKPNVGVRAKASNQNVSEWIRGTGLMLQELPNFHVRQSTGFSSDVATAVAAFTAWSVAVDPTHTPEKSMELVGKEAYTLAAGLIEKDIGYKEEEPAPNYEWMRSQKSSPAVACLMRSACRLGLKQWISKERRQKVWRVSGWSQGK